MTFYYTMFILGLLSHYLSRTDGEQLQVVFFYYYSVSFSNRCLLLKKIKVLYSFDVVV